MEQFLVFLLFLAPTIQYRAEFGSFSLALMEPVVLGISIILFWSQLNRNKKIILLNNPFVFLFIGIMLWAMAMRAWSGNNRGFSDIRDWAIPLIGFLAITSTIRSGWYRWITLFFLLVFIQASLGIFQHFTDLARPFMGGISSFKTGFMVSPEDATRLLLVSPAVGLFTHPNDLGIFLFLGLMTGLGLMYKARNPWLVAPFVLVIALALYWTYAKASMIMVALSVLLFFLQPWKRSDRFLFLLLVSAPVFIVSAIWVAVKYMPPALLSTFWWRVGLWNTAFDVIASHPQILLFGNGLTTFAEQAYYGQPHNLFIFLLLEYGIFGFLWALLLIVLILVYGWRHLRSGPARHNPVLAALWIALLGYLLIGLVESNLLGIENRMIFFLFAACFIGMARELWKDAKFIKRESLTDYGAKQVEYPHTI